MYQKITERKRSIFLRIQGSFFANIIRGSRRQLWVGYFIYFKFTPVLFYLMFLLDLFCSIKGINQNIYFKVTIEKNWHSQNFDFLGAPTHRDIIKF